MRAELEALHFARPTRWSHLATIALALIAACTEEKKARAGSDQVDQPIASSPSVVAPADRSTEEEDGKVTVKTFGKFSPHIGMEICLYPPVINGAINQRSRYQNRLLNIYSRRLLINSIHASEKRSSSRGYPIVKYPEWGVTCKNADDIKIQQHYADNKYGKPYSIVIIARQRDNYIQLSLDRKSGISPVADLSSAEIDPRSDETIVSIIEDNKILTSEFAEEFSLISSK